MGQKFSVILNSNGGHWKISGMGVSLVGEKNGITKSSNENNIGGLNWEESN